MADTFEWNVVSHDGGIYTLTASDLRVEGLGNHVVATLFDENGPIAVFNDPESVILASKDDSILIKDDNN